MIPEAPLPDYKRVFVKDLREFSANSRTHSDEQIGQVVDSIKEFGFTNPLLIGDDNTIIAGHCRLEAAKRLGMGELPCIVLSGLTDDQKAAYVIADNQLALNAGWNLDVLRDQLNHLDANGFDLNLIGFSDEELENLMSVDVLQSFANEDEVPELPSEPVTKVGDVWLLGQHRLMCGDSTIITDVDKLLNGQHPNTMITDPPYGVKYEASWRADAKGSKKTAREVSSNLKNDDRADWYDAYVLFPGSVAYVWHASAFTDVVMDGLRRAGFEIKQQIIWNKNVHALSRSDYHWKHEPCWYAVKKDGNRNWKGGRSQMTIWDVQSIVSEKDKTAHPTQKPVELFVRSINHHTNPGEYVYDPFAGSGTLMVAAEKTNRRALCMELDPIYCDLILERYKRLTNDSPVLENNNNEDAR